MKRLTRTGASGEVSVDIAAPPERVWALVSDVTRMGEWSPECRRCVWLGGANGPAPGARFAGFNRRGPIWWVTIGKVEEAEPGRVFSFHTTQPWNGRTPVTRWTYRFEPAGDGTRVTESFQVLNEVLLSRFGMLVFGDSGDRLVDGMRQTLDRVKAAAER
ncbi:MAG TPA: SRPBCC family protein [Actinomycetota bacterium]|nr:SRPBCC family protein [Actinomycetota bacterium]